MNTLKYIIISYFLFSTCSSMAFSASDDHKKEAPVIEFQHILDKREVKSTHSPLSLNAVGKLSSKRKKRNADKSKLNCTANLVAASAGIGSDIILTAKHCISNSIIQYKWKTSTEKGTVERRAKVVYTDKKNDWALLQLKTPVSYKDVKPLIVNYKTFNNENFSSDNSEDYLIAGFSVDWLGGYGKLLTYENKPSFVDFSTSSKGHIGKVGALTHQGDSGGAVIYEYENQSYLVGMMSHISSDQHLFKSKKGTFGNLSGYFLDLITYESLSLVLTRFLR